MSKKKKGGGFLSRRAQSAKEFTEKDLANKGGEITPDDVLKLTAPTESTTN